MSDPNPNPRTNVLRWIAVVALVLGLLVCLAAAWWLRRARVHSVINLVAAGRAAVGERRFEDAYRLLSEATALSTDQADLAKLTAQAAYDSGRRTEALAFARRAWDGGARDEETLALLLIGTPTDDHTALVTKAEALVGQLPDEVQRLRMRARLSSERGDDGGAIRLWQEAIALVPTPTAIATYGEVLARGEHGEELRSSFQNFRERRLLNADGYRQLALAEALHNLRVPAGERCDTVALLDEARERKQYDDHLRIDHALHLALRLELVRATTVLREVRDDDRLVDAQLFLAYFLGELGRSGEYPTLAQLPQPSGAAGEGVALILSTLASSANLDDRLLALEKAARLVGEHPALHLLQARLLNEAGRPVAALSHFQALSGLIVFLPSVMIAQAETLAALDHPQQALSLLAELHQLAGATRRSLTLTARLAKLTGDGPLLLAIERSAQESAATDPDLAQLVESLRAQRGGKDLDDRELGGPGVAGLDQAQHTILLSIRTALTERRFSDVLATCAELAAPAEVLAAHRALALQGLGRADEVIGQCAIARRQPQPAAIDLAESAANLQLHRSAAARTAAERVLARFPDDAEANLLLVLIALDAGDAAGAQAAVRVAQASGAATPELVAAGCLALVAAGKRDEALRTALAVLQDAPGELVAANLAGDLLGAEGRFSEAQAVLSRALALNPDEPGLARRLAETLLMLGDSAQACALLQRLVSVHPEDPALHLAYLRLLEQRADVSGAQAALTALPATTDARTRALASATVLRLQGQPAAAQRALDGQLADLECATQWALLAVAQRQDRGLGALFAPLPPDRDRRIRVATACETAERWGDALALMDQALAAAPDDAGILNNWAWYALHVPTVVTPERARTCAARALELAPGHPGILDTYAATLLASHRAGTCRELLDAHPEAVATTPQLQVALGRARLELGDQGGALAIWRQAQTLACQAPRWPLRESASELEQLMQSATP